MGGDYGKDEQLPFGREICYSSNKFGYSARSAKDSAALELS